jgi:glutathione S-transferase
MKLYFHPVSTTCRPVMLFAAESDIKLEFQLVDLFKGEHMQEPYCTVNPSRCVPLLEDGDFRLAESSAILKYLADTVKSPAYPSDLKQRAHVNERMDWFNTGFYRDFGYGLLYPQILPHYKNEDQKVQNAIISAGRERAKKWLGVLDANIIGPAHGYVCGNTISIADYLGAAIVTTGEVIRLDYSAYPNIQRWLANMKALRRWKSVNEGFYTHFVAPYKDTPFQGL